jgi:hypothetical protein
MNLHPILLVNAENCRLLLGQLVPRNCDKGDIFDSFEEPRYKKHKQETEILNNEYFNVLNRLTKIQLLMTVKSLGYNLKSSLTKDKIITVIMKSTNMTKENSLRKAKLF